MISLRNLLILGTLVLLDSVIFLVVAPAVSSAVPPEFWDFVFAFLALLFVYSGIAFGFLGLKFRPKKSKVRETKETTWGTVVTVHHLPDTQDSE